MHFPVYFLFGIPSEIHLCGVLQGDRMWRFAVGLYLVYLSGGELRLAAIFGFSAGGAIILFGGMIGNWVDNNSRLKGNYFQEVFCEFSENVTLVLV